MTDFLEHPVGDFDWGPRRRLVAFLRQALPGLAIGAGLTLALAGLLLLAHG